MSLMLAAGNYLCVQIYSLMLKRMPTETTYVEIWEVGTVAYVPTRSVHLPRPSVIDLCVCTYAATGSWVRALQQLSLYKKVSRLAANAMQRT